MIFARAFVQGTVAWILGVAVGATLGLFLGVFVAGPIGTIVGAMALGALYGLAQAHALGAPKRFAVITAFVAPIAWFAGSFVAWRAFVLGASAASPWLQGIVVGLVVSLAQARCLPRDRRATWILAGTSALALAIGAMLAPLPLAARAASLALPGLLVAASRLIASTRLTLERSS